MTAGRIAGTRIRSYCCFCYWACRRYRRSVKSRRANFCSGRCVIRRTESTNDGDRVQERITGHFRLILLNIFENDHFL